MLVHKLLNMTVYVQTRKCIVTFSNIGLFPIRRGLFQRLWQVKRFHSIRFPTCFSSWCSSFHLLAFALVLSFGLWTKTDYSQYIGDDFAVDIKLNYTLLISQLIVNERVNIKIPLPCLFYANSKCSATPCPNQLFPWYDSISEDI